MAMPPLSKELIRKLESGADITFSNEEKVFRDCQPKDINGRQVRCLNRRDGGTLVAVTLSPRDYQAYQELGLTEENDQSLTAKIIGIFGKYRYQAEKDYFKNKARYGAQDARYRERTHYAQKTEVICQYTFKRLRLLQNIERTFGRSPDEIHQAISVYEKEVLQALADPEFGLVCTVENVDAALRDYLKRNQLLPANASLAAAAKLKMTHVKGLVSDLKRVQSLKRKIPADDDYDRDIHSTKDMIENFTREGINVAIRDARLAHELTTLAGRFSFYRGSFHKALVTADKEAANDYLFDQWMPISEAHQGIFECDAEKDEKITHLMWGTRAQVRKALFGTAMILEGDRPKSGLRDSRATRTWRSDMYHRGKNIWEYITGVERQKDKKYSHVVDMYKNLCEGSLKASISHFEAVQENFINAVYVIGMGLSRIVMGLGTSIYASCKKIVTDFYEDENPIQEIAKEIKRASDREAKRRSLHEAVEDIRDQSVEDFYAKTAVLKPPSKIPTDADNKERSPARLAVTPYELHPQHPNNIVSAGLRAAKEFCDVIIKTNAESPTISSLAATGYILAGLCILQPALVIAMGKKMGIDLAWFVKWHVETAKIMSEGKIPQSISASSTFMTEIQIVGQGFVDPEHSIGGDAFKFMVDNYLLAFTAIFGAAALGRGVVLVVPSLGKEMGALPVITETFAGFKFGAITYGALRSSRHEFSLLESTVMTIFNITVLPIRLLLSPVNLLFRLLFSLDPRRALLPWLDALDMAVNGALIFCDLILGSLYLVGRILKSAVALVFETTVNCSVNMIKMMTCPAWDPIQNPIVQAMIRGKFKLYEWSDWVTRAVKEVYVAWRSRFAREEKDEVTFYYRLREELWLVDVVQRQQVQGSQSLSSTAQVGGSLGGVGNRSDIPLAQAPTSSGRSSSLTLLQQKKESPLAVSVVPGAGLSPS
ncbi:MAG TPA: hypothetical protein VNC84_02290 [Gammaproteobacteria bacterium]|jgi:hypothetical protein|nr:hypothetical protein [Gammaproteobacteria bacterium]